jgi:Arc/MetJ-type ribon-helix-helix transcriptional regulator
MVPLNLRIPRSLVEALDEEVARENEGNPFLQLNRSDIIRAMLSDAVMQRRAARAAGPSTAAPAPAKGKAATGKGKR